MRILKTIRRALLFPVILLTLLTTPTPVNTDTAAFLGQDVFVMAEALAKASGGRLVEIAKSRGAPDNVTVVLISV